MQISKYIGSGVLIFAVLAVNPKGSEAKKPKMHSCPAGNVNPCIPKGWGDCCCTLKTGKSICCWSIDVGDQGIYCRSPDIQIEWCGCSG